MGGKTMSLNGNGATHPKKSRDELRAGIFKARETTKEYVSFFGEMIELRQPTLGDVLMVQEAVTDGDKTTAVIEALCKYAYVPDTDEKVFEEADSDMLKGLPFGKDFTDVSEALGRLSNLSFGNANADSSQAVSDSQQ
jgi:hypothetical protein